MAGAAAEVAPVPNVSFISRSTKLAPVTLAQAIPVINSFAVRNETLSATVKVSMHDKTVGVMWLEPVSGCNMFV